MTHRRGNVPAAAYDGVVLGLPPPFAEWGIVPILAGDSAEGWSIRAPLWSEEEDGRSDLERFLTASSSTAGEVTVKFDDIHVS